MTDRSHCLDHGSESPDYIQMAPTSNPGLSWILSVANDMVTLKPQFVTRYHVEIATTDWLRAIEHHVTSSIACHPEYHTSSGRGVVSSRYNEERFMGPLSLVKNDFDVVVHVLRRFSIRKDRYEATVRFTPESNRFENLRETVETIETKRRDNRNFKLVARLCADIGIGCDRSVVDNWRCPWCNSAIRVSFHRAGRTFAISCPHGHFHRHAGTTKLPDWWREAITDGWLECGGTVATEHLYGPLRQ